MTVAPAAIDGEKVNALETVAPASGFESLICNPLIGLPAPFTIWSWPFASTAAVAPAKPAAVRYAWMPPARSASVLICPAPAPTVRVVEAAPLTAMVIASPASMPRPLPFASYSDVSVWVPEVGVRYAAVCVTVPSGAEAESRLPA